MIELFQITGSASFAARIALEEAGADYETVDIHPRRRDEPASFAEVNPLKRVPALREGDVTVYETGAVLLWLADRFPDGSGRPSAIRARATLYRWILWLADTLHTAWWPIMKSPVTRARGGRARADPRQGREQMDAHGAYLERELARGPWCLGDDVLGGRPVPLHAGRLGELHPGRLPARRRARARALPARGRAAGRRAHARARGSRRAPHPLPPGAARGPADLTRGRPLSSPHGDSACDRTIRSSRSRRPSSSAPPSSCARALADARFVSIGLHEPPKADYLAWLAGGARPARCALAIAVDREHCVHELVCDLDAGALTSRAGRAGRALADHARGLRGRRGGRARRCRLARGDAATRGGGCLARADRRARLGRLRARGGARPPRRARGRLPAASTPGDNGYAHPIESLIAYVDVDECRVLELEEMDVKPIPEEPTARTPRGRPRARRPPAVRDHAARGRELRGRGQRGRAGTAGRCARRSIRRRASSCTTCASTAGPCCTAPPARR